MKMHGQFTQELIKTLDDFLPSVMQSTRDNLRDQIVRLSRMGLAPEAKGSIPQNRIVDAIYAMPLETFIYAPTVKTDPTPPPVKPQFEFSALSLTRSIKVYGRLMDVAKLALTKYSTVDFGFTENQHRTEHEQREKVNAGVSKTMESCHRIDATGCSYALDCVAWIDGKFSWDWDAYYRIAYAMDQAATELKCADKIRWGGAWDRRLSDFGGELELYKAEVEAYKIRHPGKDFIDGPHFEWVR